MKPTNADLLEIKASMNRVTNLLSDKHIVTCPMTSLADCTCQLAAIEKHLHAAYRAADLNYEKPAR